MFCWNCRQKSNQNPEECNDENKGKQKRKNHLCHEVIHNTLKAKNFEFHRHQFVAAHHRVSRFLVQGNKKKKIKRFRDWLQQTTQQRKILLTTQPAWRGPRPVFSEWYNVGSVSVLWSLGSIFSVARSSSTVSLPFKILPSSPKAFSCTPASEKWFDSITSSNFSPKNGFFFECEKEREKELSSEKGEREFLWRLFFFYILSWLSCSMGSHSRPPQSAAAQIQA